MDTLVEALCLLVVFLVIAHAAIFVVFGAFCLYCHRNKSLGWHWDRRDR